MDMRPVFVIGPPRTGTTLLGKLLANGEAVLSLSEPFHLNDLLPPWALRHFYARFQRDSHLRRVPFPRDRRPARYFRFLQDMARENDLRYLVIKEVFHEIDLHPRWGNFKLLDNLAAQQVPIIAIIRHPWDAAASTVGLLRRLFFGWRGRVIRTLWPTVPRFRDDDHIVNWAARNWVHFVEWTRDRNLFVVRYEDLVREPAAALRRVCDHAGMPFADSMLDHHRWPQAFAGIGAPEVLFRGGQPVHAQSVGRGRHLTASQQLTLDEICGPHMAALGYETLMAASA